MQTTVKKWGNSASVRIPVAVMQALSLKLDDTVEIREEGGRIVIEPVRPEPCSLEALLDAITPENLHASIETGAPVGNEVL